MWAPFFVFSAELLTFVPVKTFRLIFRFLFFAAYTSIIVAEIWWRNLLWGFNRHRSMQIRRRWARNLLRGVGLKITTQGIPPDYPCLIVCNHRSYLDPILLLRDVNAFPVAKAELAAWPILGKGAKMAGILYLKRESAGSRSGILRQMLEKIESGYPVIIFPEGTTSDLPGTLPFKIGGFKMAAQSNIPVVPVALIFKDKSDYWVGKISFFNHARKNFGDSEKEITLIYGPKLQHADPDDLLATSKAWIDAHLHDPA